MSIGQSPYSSNPYTYGGYNNFNPSAGGYVNPYAQVTQQRIDQILQQNPQIAQTIQPSSTQQVQPAGTLPIRATPVTSIDEARAAQISLDNTLYIFQDTSNGKIYTKQFDVNTGGSNFRTYVPEDTQVPQEQPAPQPTPQLVVEEPPPQPELEEPQGPPPLQLRDEIGGLKEEFGNLYSTSTREFSALRVDIDALRSEMKTVSEQIKGVITNVTTSSADDGTDKSASKPVSATSKSNAKKRNES